ncbi:MAG: transglycosylase domain-containing protein [Bacteroidota bacterium]
MQYPIKAYFRAIIDRLKYGWQGRWQMLVAYVRRQPLWKLLLVGLGGPLAIALLIFGIIFLGIHFGWYGSLPTHMEIASIRNNQASAVYSADGALLGKYYVENRIDAELEEISPFVIDGLIATEDARFFEHSGIDLRALARVAWKSILLGDESSGGGSTIASNWPKIYFPDAAIEV